MLASLRALWRYRDLVRNLVARDLRVKYKGSSIGFAWSLLHPLLIAAVYTFAFRYVIEVPIAHFPLFLLSGMLPWTFFSGSLAMATGSVADNSSLVRKVAFPRVILPVGAVASQFAQFALMYAVIIPVGAALGPGATQALLALVPLVLLQLVFTLGLALVLATAYVYFRDTRHLLDVALQILFWLTPVVYAASLVPEGLRRVLWLNPMAGFVTTYHGIVVDGRWPSAQVMGVLALVSAVAAVTGFAVFARHQRRFAELV
ncbi:MAG: ABC transporter permease [Vicinamibacterales bacterium]|nr:ABC transporter permease [Vicinamibacterales bacterium]